MTNYSLARDIIVTVGETEKFKICLILMDTDGHSLSSTNNWEVSESSFGSSFGSSYVVVSDFGKKYIQNS